MKKYKVTYAKTIIETHTVEMYANSEEDVKKLFDGENYSCEDLTWTEEEEKDFNFLDSVYGFANDGSFLLDELYQYFISDSIINSETDYVDLLEVEEAQKDDNDL